MLYNICYITFPKWLYNIQICLYDDDNIRDGYITHPTGNLILPDVAAAANHLSWAAILLSLSSYPLSLCLPLASSIRASLPLILFLPWARHRLFRVKTRNSPRRLWLVLRIVCTRCRILRDGLQTCLVQVQKKCLNKVFA